MRPTRESRIAYILSLWPFAFFAFAIGITWLLFFSMAAGAEAFREALWTLFGDFVFHVVMGQMAGASPLVSSLAPIALLSGLGGTVLGFALRGSREDEDTVNVATRAGIFGFSSPRHVCLAADLSRRQTKWSRFSRKRFSQLLTMETLCLPGD